MDGESEGGIFASTPEKKSKVEKKAGDKKTTRYAIVLPNKEGVEENIFKDGRTFQSKDYARKKVENLEAGWRMGNQVPPDFKIIPVKAVCPYCQGAYSKEDIERVADALTTQLGSAFSAHQDLALKAEMRKIAIKVANRE